MTTKYRLKKHDGVFKKIFRNREWVGRVAHYKGTWYATIGNTTISAPSEMLAYEEIVRRDRKNLHPNSARRSNTQMTKKPHKPHKPTIVLPAPVPEERIYYWAYGSNLCVRQMQHRCPGAEQIGALTLDNSLLVFRGVADVVGYKGYQTQGGLWHITRQHEATLDRQEGVRSQCYRKVYINLAMDDGQTQQCLLYQMCQRGIMPPTESYIDVIAQGYRDFGLDLAYLDDALRRAWDHKALTPYLRRRRELDGRKRARLLTMDLENASETSR